METRDRSPSTSRMTATTVRGLVQVKPAMERRAIGDKAVSPPSRWRVRQPFCLRSRHRDKPRREDMRTRSKESTSRVAVNPMLLNAAAGDLRYLKELKRRRAPGTWTGCNTTCIRLAIRFATPNAAHGPAPGDH